MSNTPLDKENLDFLEKIFNRGLTEGVAHSKPSPETLERLNKIEVTLESMMESFKDHSRKSEERIEQIVLEFREGMKDVMSIKEFLNNAAFTKKFLIGSGGVIAAMVSFFWAVYVMIKTLINGN